MFHVNIFIVTRLAVRAEFYQCTLKRSYMRKHRNCHSLWIRVVCVFKSLCFPVHNNTIVLTSVFLSIHSGHKSDEGSLCYYKSVDDRWQCVSVVDRVWERYPANLYRLHTLYSAIQLNKNIIFLNCQRLFRNTFRYLFTGSSKWIIIVLLALLRNVAVLGLVCMYLYFVFYYYTFIYNFICLTDI